MLGSLLIQGVRNVEIVVVNQDEGPGPVETCLRNYERDLRITHIHDDGIGLSRARNLGLRQAAGSIIGFPDDDCWYADDVLTRVARFFCRNNDVGLLCGIYSEPDRVNEHFPTRSVTLTPRNVFDRVCSVGLFIRRDLVNESELYFDEALGAGSGLPAGEEHDLAMRLLAAGTPGLYCPSLVVYHAIERHIDDVKLLNDMHAAFWYVVGKNFSTVAAGLRLTRGVLGALLKASPSPVLLRIRAILRGYRMGRMRRQPVDG